MRAARVSLRERISLILVTKDESSIETASGQDIFQAVLRNFAIWSMVFLVAPWFFLITSRPLLAID